MLAIRIHLKPATISASINNTLAHDLHHAFHPFNRDLLERAVKLYVIDREL